MDNKLKEISIKNHIFYCLKESFNMNDLGFGNITLNKNSYEDVFIYLSYQK